MINHILTRQEQEVIYLEKTHQLHNDQYEFDFATVMDLHKTANGLVDVCVGPMTAKETANELLNYAQRCPDYLVIIMERNKGKYKSAIYIDNNTFQNRNTIKK